MEHIAQFHGNHAIKCHFCPKKFTKWWDMNDHLISVHSIKCQLCQARLNKEFDQHICDLQSMDPAANKNEIIKHIRINDVEVGLISKSFQSPKNVNSKGEKHQCLSCPTIFLKEEGLKRHVISVHSIKCPLCLARFMTNKELDQHIRDLQSQSMDPAANKNGLIKDATGGLISESFQSPKSRNSKGEEHQCLICQTVFLKEEGLKRHIVKVHEGSQRQVTVVPKSSYSTSTNHKIREEFGSSEEITERQIEIKSKIKPEVELEIKEEASDEFEAHEQACIDFITGKEFDNNQITSQTEDMLLVNKSKKFESNYDKYQSSWKISGKNQEIPEWFVCLECAPHKILQDSDQSMDKHFAENPEHYQINPAWFYLKFNLYVTDIARQSQIKCHQESSEQVMCLGENIGFSKHSDLKEHFSSVQKKDSYDLETTGCSKHELTEEQLTLCRKIRRKEKNKVAARNSRIRKIEQIKQLEHNVQKNICRKTAKNMELKGKVADLEIQVAKFKTAISDMLKKRTTKHVQTCPEGASITSSTTSYFQNDPSIGVETNSILLTRKEPESPTTKFK